MQNWGPVQGWHTHAERAVLHNGAPAGLAPHASHYCLPACPFRPQPCWSCYPKTQPPRLSEKIAFNRPLFSLICAAFGHLSAVVDLPRSPDGHSLSLYAVRGSSTLINLRRTLMAAPREIGAEGLVELRSPRIPFRQPQQNAVRKQRPPSAARFVPDAGKWRCSS